MRAAEHVAKGQVILDVVGRVTRTANRHSIQTGWDTHMTGPDGLPPEASVSEYGWRFLNHSCAPNAYLDGLTLVALTSIEPDAEVTCDYNTFEWDMAHPFECACGAAACVGTVRGYRHLPESARTRLRPYLAGYLRGRTRLEPDDVADHQHVGAPAQGGSRRDERDGG